MATLMSIFGNQVFIQAALSIIGYIVGKSAQDSQLRRSFQQLVEDLHGEALLPVDLRDKYIKQVEDNAKKAAEEWKRDHP